MNQKFRDTIMPFQPGELFAWYFLIAVPLQDLYGWPPCLSAKA